MTEISNWVYQWKKKFKPGFFKATPEVIFSQKVNKPSSQKTSVIRFE